MPEKDPLLSIQNLSIAFRGQDGGLRSVVKALSFDIKKGETFALVGESGSGKSVSALSLLRLLPKECVISGSVRFKDSSLMDLVLPELNAIRGNRISMVFQEPMTSLNPLHSIYKQISEVIELHQIIDKKSLRTRIEELLELVGLGNLITRLSALPHELSGGQRQRVMIAMALANKPDLLIADEPTTALDVTVQQQILELLDSLRRRFDMSMLFITHDLRLVKKMAERVGILKNGELVEIGSTTSVFARPNHEYTKKLLSSEHAGSPVPMSQIKERLFVGEQVSVRFPLKKNFFGGVTKWCHAVNNASLTLNKGETLGIVGESGSGKTTLALALLRLLPSKGVIMYGAHSLHTMHKEALRPLRAKFQIVFQDPFSSLNPRFTVGDILKEGLYAHGARAEEEALLKVRDALKDVGLEAGMLTRYPHEFSGGQRQRISLARALVLDPECIVLDEPTSALDVCTQAEILNLLKKLQKARGISYFFISHDLRVVKSIAHRVMVMKNGEIVEFGSNAEIFGNPKSDYTKTLIHAALD